MTLSSFVVFNKAGPPLPRCGFKPKDMAWGENSGFAQGIRGQNAKNLTKSVYQKRRLLVHGLWG